MTRDRKTEFDDLSTQLQRNIEPPPSLTPTFVFEVCEGPATGRSFIVDGHEPSRILLGEGPACTIRFGDRQISRRHAAIDFAGQRLRLTDLGSKNGTFVDGVAIVEVFLRGGETVRVGGTAFRVERGEPSAGPPIPAATRFGRLIGASVEMRRLYPLCTRLAASPVPVVIEGETGTGKEVLAEALHEEGPRSAGPFVVFDCTSVPPSLVESELFGHERGAFTGAVSSRKGVFELAHRGTLFIDEIGDLETSLQPKLLRAVERSEIRRIGGDRPVKVDVRLLAATRRDLDQEVQNGRFRDDLFHRLAVTRIELPPLRERRGDIAVLAQHFWRELGGQVANIPAEVMFRWEAERWPGNVRELRNAVARQLALGELAEKGPPQPTEPAAVSGDPGVDADVLEQILALDLPFPRARDRVLSEFEQRYVERILRAHGGNVARAAAASGIGRRYFATLRTRSSK
jgi:DNA-binding NtrC family response regulator